MMSIAWRSALAVLVLSAPRVALAADLPVQSAPQPTVPAAYTPASPDWIVTVGLEGRIIPAWPGASGNKFTWSGLPLFSIRNEGMPPDYFGPRDSFGIRLINLAQFKFGPAISFVWERKAADYTQLYGLGDVNYAVQAGVFAEFWAVPWVRLRGEVRQGIGGETGVTGDVFLDAVVPVGQFRLSAGPRVTLQTAAAVSPYFSITQAQAITANALQPGLPTLTAYSASGGLYSYGAGGEVEYFFSPQWTAHAFTEYQRLTGSAADSPIVTQRGSPNQFTYGLGATYSFTMHPWW